MKFFVNIMPFLKKLFLSLLAVVATVSCNSIPAPPVFVPFDIAKKGATSTFKFRVSEEQKYSFSLAVDWNDEIYQRDQRKGLYSKEEHEKSKAKAIHLKLFQIEKENKTIILERDFSDYRSDGWWNGGAGYKIATVHLKPGRYEVTATSLDDINVYNKISAVARIGISPPRRK